MKKEEEDKGFLKGSRTVKNGSNPSIYKAWRRKENEKRKKKKTYGSRTQPCSKTSQFMELCPQTCINTGFLNTVPTFVHNHFTFLFALEEESINEFFSTKKTLEKEEDNALFSKVYIFSRTNYNLPSAKTLSAMTSLLSWQNIFILMADYKLSSSSSKNSKNNPKKTPKIPPSPSSKKSPAALHILLFLSHIFYFY